MAKWVWVTTNLLLHPYGIREEPGEPTEPVRPGLTSGGVLAIAFRDRIIDRLGYPRVQGLCVELSNDRW